MDMIQRPRSFAGIVEPFLVDAQGNELRSLGRAHNTVQFDGFDVLGQIMSGAILSSINAMYFQFAAVGTDRSPAGQSYTHTSFSGLSATLDYARIQLSPGVLSASGGSYASNQATFSGILADGTAGELGNLVFAGGTHEIEVFALVVAPDWSDPTDDYVYAIYTPSPSLATVASNGVGLRWLSRFVT